MEPPKFSDHILKLIEQHPITAERGTFGKSKAIPDYVPPDQIFETLDPLSRFLSELANNPVAIEIFSEGGDALRRKLFQILGNFNSASTLQSLPLKQCRNLAENATAQNVSDADLWESVLNLTTETAGKNTSKPVKQRPQYIDELEERTAKIAWQGWKQPYTSNSLDILTNLIDNYEKNEKLPDLYYAKTLVFTQSSGMGKSRLALEYGRDHPTINFVFGDRKNKIPPGDPEIVEIIDSVPGTDFLQNISQSKVSRIVATQQLKQDRGYIIWYHSIATGLLQASLEKFEEWLDKSFSNHRNGSTRLAEIATAWQQHMGAEEQDRNDARIEFCKNVAEKTKETIKDLTDDHKWWDVFQESTFTSVRHYLLEHQRISQLQDTAKACVAKLRNLTAKDSGCMLGFCFDEASRLLFPAGENELRPGLYIALNRLLTCLRDFPIWSLVSSTESRVESLLPPTKLDSDTNPSDKQSPRKVIKDSPENGRVEVLRRFSPFLAFPLDIGDRKVMTENKAAEAGKTLKDYASEDHMVLFGRPLWSAYVKSPEDLEKIAQVKLLGESDRYDAKDRNHVFAVLSFRLSLDVLLQNPVSLPLSRTAVNSYMRVMVGMEQDSGLLDTISPSEPILSRAAMQILCANDAWPITISSLSTELLDMGIIEKGLKGELYARMMLILAQDCALRQKKQSANEKPTFRSYITIREFLKALYGDSHHAELEKIDGQVLGAYINFTHFTSAGEDVKSDDVPALCRDLLRRQAAMQLAPSQPTYDIFIPAQIDTDEFGTSKIVSVVVQVKNKAKPVSPQHILERKFEYVAGSQSASGSARTQKPNPTDLIFQIGQDKRPILFLVFDLGVQGHTFSISKWTGTSHVWAIHTHGHDEKVFGCLERMNCVDEANRFFTAQTVDDSAHDRLARRNWVFREVGEGYRYGRNEEEEEQEEKSGQTGSGKQSKGKSSRAGEKRKKSGSSRPGRG